MINRVKIILLSNNAFLLFLLINIVISTLSLVFLNCIYDVIDDFGLSMVASGAFGQEYTQCLIYSNSILGWIIRILNSIYRINYYMIIQYVLITLSSALFASIVTIKTKKIKIGLVSLLLWWGVFFGGIFTNITYTTTAGVISIVGLIGIIVYFDNSPILSVVSLIVSLFGFMYRYKAFLLVLPFALIYLFFSRRKIINNGKFDMKFVKCVLLLIICIGMCIGTDVYTYRSNELKEFKETNRLRELLQDYSNDYSKENINNGWSENDYIMFYKIKNDNKEKFGSENLSKILNAATRKTKSLLDVLMGIKNFYTNTFTISQIILIALLFIVSIFCGRRVFIYTLITHIFNIGIAAYFIYQGRFPIRVSHILLFCVLMLVYLYILDTNVSINRIILIILIICSCTLMISGIIKKHKARYVGFNIVEHIKNDNKHDYVLDPAVIFNITSCYIPIDNIPTSLFDNMIFAGGWTHPSPMSENVCKKFGGLNSFEVLSKRDDVYYVTYEYENINIVEKYLQENYDDRIKAKFVEKLGEDVGRGNLVSYIFVHE